MGTRNLTAVMSGGEYKIAQYGQWDGYPDGQGLTALEFCRKQLSCESGRRSFRELLKRCRFVSDDEYKAKMVEIGLDKQFVTMDEGRRIDAVYPYMSRDLGANILEKVANSLGDVALIDSIDFAGDSLFCEWAYVVDLDKNTFEAYRGFTKKPVPKTERFASAKQNGRNNDYYPIRLSGSWSLDDLPTEKEFLASFRQEDEDE